MVVLNCAPLRLDFDEQSFALRRSGELLVPTFARTVGQLKPVLLDANQALQDSRQVYWVYRSVARESDVGKFGLAGLEYDVTVIDHVFLRPERVKTFGHYHPLAFGGLSFPEVYEVLSGKACFLLQKRSEHDSHEVKEVLAVRASSGDKVVVPPNYGHVTINEASEPLVVSNIQALATASDYTSYAHKSGAAYYELEGGQFIPNKNFHKLPPLRVVEAKHLKHARLFSKTNLYSAFVNEPRAFSFLRDPRVFNW